MVYCPRWLNAKGGGVMGKPVRRTARLALMTAVICVIAPLQIPLGTIPVTLQTLVIALTGYMLGWRDALAATAAYLLLGAVGLPVFSGWTGGIGVVLGPTGGFLLGFPALTVACGWGKGKSLAVQALLGAAGLIVMNALGAAWLMKAAGMSLQAALAAGVWPFLLKDGICILAAMRVARQILARMKI